MHKFFKQNNKGFTLVETLVAISIFTASILGLISVLASGISNVGYAKKKIMATYLAQEGIEYARNIRDTHVLYEGVSGWNNFLEDSSIKDYPITERDFEGFTRTLSVNPVGKTGEVVEVVSTVLWTQGSGDYSVSFNENLFKWAE